jgi:hypothetical protein
MIEEKDGKNKEGIEELGERHQEVEMDPHREDIGTAERYIIP